MTVFVTFVLGPKEAYFFNTPTHWAWRNLPADVESLFIKQPPIKDVIELALGDNGTYFISYRDHDGQLLCRHYNLPNPLVTYLYASQPQVIRDLTTLSITLGPYESYYAHDRNSASWSNLPPSLEKSLLNRLESQSESHTTWKGDNWEAPSFMCLGADGSYFMRTVSGGGSWDLKSKQEGVVGINRFLEGCADFTNVAGLYLFPHHPNAYILLLTSGEPYSNLPEFTWADYNKMADKLPVLRQSRLPIPAVPQVGPSLSTSAPQQSQNTVLSQQSVQPQSQPVQQQNHQPGCCPQSNGQYNCCPPALGAMHHWSIQRNGVVNQNGSIHHSGRERLNGSAQSDVNSGFWSSSGQTTGVSSTSGFSHGGVGD